MSDPDVSMIWGWWFWMVISIVAVVLVIYFASKMNKK